MSVSDASRLELSAGPTAYSRASDTDITAAAAAVAGVTAAATLVDYDVQPVYARDFEAVSLVPTFIGIGDVRAVLDCTVLEGAIDADADVMHALVGSYAAEALQLGPIAAQPVIAIDDSPPIPVAAIIEDVPRMPELESAVVLVNADWRPRGTPAQTLTLTVTTPGAAQQVATQLPHVIDPVDPFALEVVAPVDPRDLRQEVESSVAVALAVALGFAAITAALSLANMMLASVRARTGEFGLRRAVGARRQDLFALIMTESVAIGVLGGVAGLVLGLLGLLGLSISQQWLPVIDPVVVPVALFGGILAGVVSGLAGAVRASRIEPAQALRH